MDAMEPPRPNASALPAADVQVPVATTGSVVNHAFPVKQPEEDLSEFLVRVRASVLTRVRTRLTDLSTGHFPFSELLLGISTLAIGAALGAIPANLDFKVRMGKFFYLVLPVLGAATLVGYLLSRKQSLLDAKRIATEILGDLPDPTKAR